MKRKEKPTGRWHDRNTHLRKQVVLTYLMYGSGRLLLSIKKEVSGTFSFTCPVTALPVCYRRRLTLCTVLSLSTWPPKVVTPNYLCFDCIILKKMEKNYEDINTIFSVSILRCFRSTGYLLLITAYE